MDWDGPLPVDDDSTVFVPDTLMPLSTTDIEELVSLVNPLANSEQFGIDLYVQSVQFVLSRIH